MKIILVLLVVAVCVLEVTCRFTIYECLENETSGRCNRRLDTVCKLERATFPNRCAACTDIKKLRYWIGDCAGLTKGKGKTRALVHECTARERDGLCTLNIDTICARVKVQYNNRCRACEGEKRIRYRDGPCKRPKSKKP